MILAVFFWFTLLYFFGYKIENSGNIFSPIRFISLKFALLNLGFILYIHFYPESFIQDILLVTGVSIDDAFFQYAVVQTIAYISLLLGMSVITNKQMEHNIDVKPKGHFLFLGLVLYAIGLYSFISFIIETGGIVYLLANLSNRVELLSGQNLNLLMPLLTLGFVVVFYDYSLKKTRGKLILLAFLAVFTILCYSSLGGRKNSLYFIITIIVAYNYFIKSINLKNIKKSTVFILGTFLVFYILIIPIARKPNGFEDLTSGKIDLVEILEVEDLVYNISYVYIDVFAANYFNSENAWYFSSFGDLYRNVNKGNTSADLLPPVDDGVYFRSVVADNVHYKPPVARSRMNKTSWPIENFGFAYANFLIPGVIIFFFLQGIVFKIVYNFAITSRMNPVSLFFYVFVLFNFNFSNLRLVQLVFILIIVVPSYIVFNKISAKS